MSERQSFAISVPGEMAPNEGQDRIALVEQPEGRDLLVKLAHGLIKPLQSPAIRIVNIVRKKDKPYAEVVLERHASTMALGPRVVEAFDETGALLFIPRQEDRFDYRWLDVHGINDENLFDINKKVGSLRINPKRGRIESLGWFGPDQQPFMDFIVDGLDIDDPNTLPSFKVRSDIRGNLRIGRLNGVDLKTRFGEPNTEAEIVSRFDPVKKYFWIEGFAADKKQEGDPVMSKRVIRGEVPKIADWRGPGIQSLVDWAYDKLPTSNLVEVPYAFDQNVKFSQIVLEGTNLIINLNGNEALDKSKPVFIIAREKGSHKWMEVQQQEDQNSEKRRLITRVFVDKSGDILDLKHRWPGPEIQALIDVVDGRGNSQDLEPFEVTINKDKRAHLFSYKDKGIWVAFRSKGFQDGDTVVLRPSIDSQGRLTLEAVKPTVPDTVLARAVFNQDTLSFNVTSTEAATKKRPVGYWTSERILSRAKEISSEHGYIDIYLASREENTAFASAIGKTYENGWTGLRADLGFIQVDKQGNYTDQDGAKWASNTGIVAIVGGDVSSVGKMLKNSGLTLLEGRGINGKTSTLYPLDEAIAYIRQARKGESSQSRISKEEANAGLDSLFEEENE